MHGLVRNCDIDITGEVNMKYMRLLFLFLIFVGETDTMFAADDRSRRTEYVQAVEKIALALKSYKKNNMGRFPETLEALVPKYLNGEALWLPTNNNNNAFKKERLIYLHRQNYRDPVHGERIIAIAPNPFEDGVRAVINEDCVVVGLNENALQRMLERRKLNKQTGGEIEIEIPF